MPRDKLHTHEGERGWEPVLRSGGLGGLVWDGNWDVSWNTLTVDATSGDGAWVAITDRDVEDFELKTRMIAVAGGNASIFFRQNSGGDYYQFDLKCELQAVLISRTNSNGQRIISAVNHDLTAGVEYEIELATRGESITSYVNGQLVNQVRDAEYRSGGICLTAWRSKARFYDPCLRVY